VERAKFIGFKFILIKVKVAREFTEFLCTRWGNGLELINMAIAD